MITRPILIKGHRLRDEFACPITRDLMRDPVIAADGHTYDREAIEMWLRSHDSSPKTGQPMDHLLVVPNHNLKRLIKDLIVEGGETLYVKDQGEPDGPAAPYRHALVPEHVLILKCLGPVESDWNGKTFRVTQRGCMGGRKMPNELKGADFMHFTDATVSRSHFEIFFDHADKCFRLRDEGSAGGSFVRIPYLVRKPLYPGLMIMLGKHQLLVREATSTGASQQQQQQHRNGGFAGGSLDLEGTVTASSSSDAKDGSRPATPVFTAGLLGHRGHGSNGSSKTGSAATEGLLDSLEHMVVESDGQMSLEDDGGGADDDSVPDTTCPAPASSSNDSAAAAGRSAAAAADPGSKQSKDDVVATGAAQTAVTSYKADLRRARGHRSVHLECFAPEGTPIQGKRYPVDKDGATLGRKQTNNIAFSHETKGQLMGIDSSISGEHARILYSPEEDCLELLDGVFGKPSTNGTWFRLSPMHERSAPHAVRDGLELLVGTVRFCATHEMMVVEKELMSQADVAKYSTLWT